MVAPVWLANETRAPVLYWWNTALGPSGLLVNPARLRLPQLGQPPIDTPHGADAEREGLKLHEYPVQNCPMDILRSLAEPVQRPLLYAWTFAVRVGDLSF